MLLSVNSSNTQQGGNTMLRSDLDAPNIYCMISGVALVALGIIGFIVSDLWGVVEFDIAHNILHLIGGGLAAYLAFSETEPLVTPYAEGSGAVYLLLGIAGFFSPTLWGLGQAVGLHFEVAENIFHLILGGWGLHAGLAPSGSPRVCRA
jgi:uncharacterized membrane protein